MIGTGDTGVLFEHRESEFGDHANLTDIMDAVQRGKRLPSGNSSTPANAK